MRYTPLLYLHGCSPPRLYLPFVECGRHEPVRFFLIHLGDVPRGDPLAAVRAVYGAVILRKVDGAVDDAIIVHLHKAALADLLVIGDETFAIGASDFKDMAAPDFFAVRILVDFHTAYTIFSPKYIFGIVVKQRFHRLYHKLKDNSAPNLFTDFPGMGLGLFLFHPRPRRTRYVKTIK